MQNVKFNLFLFVLLVALIYSMESSSIQPLANEQLATIVGGCSTEIPGQNCPDNGPHCDPKFDGGYVKSQGTGAHEVNCAGADNGAFSCTPAHKTPCEFMWNCTGKDENGNCIGCTDTPPYEVNDKNDFSGECHPT